MMGQLTLKMQNFGTECSSIQLFETVESFFEDVETNFESEYIIVERESEESYETTMQVIVDNNGIQLYDVSSDMRKKYVAEERVMHQQLETAQEISSLILTSSYELVMSNRFKFFVLKLSEYQPFYSNNFTNWLLYVVFNSNGYVYQLKKLVGDFIKFFYYKDWLLIYLVEHLIGPDQWIG